jgi:hypothetical protein
MDSVTGPGDPFPTGRTPRPLRRDERALLDGLLAREFPGVAELRVQAREAMAAPGCPCGCGTVDLHVPDGAPASSADSPTPLGGTVLDAGGEPVGMLLLFLEHGRLSVLEVCSFDDPLPLPLPERVRWEWTDR